MLANLLAILLMLLLWGLAASVGRLFVERLLPGELTAVERLLFGAAIGLGLIGGGVLLLGTVGLLNQLTLSILLLTLLLLAAFSNPLSTFWDISTMLAGLPPLLRQPLTAGLLLAMMVAEVGSLVAALAPPTDWDPMIYHLAFPNTYLRAGATVPILYDHRGLLPQGGEMLFTLALAFKQQSLTGLIHWSMGVATTVGVFALCRRVLAASRGFSSLAAAIFATTPMIMMQATTANIDLNLVFYDFLALYAFLRYAHPLPPPREGGGELEVASPSRREELDQMNGQAARHTPHSILHTSGWLILSGVMMGLAYGSKQTAIFGAGLITLLLIWQLLVVQRRGWGATTRAVLTVGLVAVAVLAVWPLRAWLTGGNPVWPFLYNVFGGAYWTAADANLQNNGYSVLYGLRFPPGTRFDTTGIYAAGGTAAVPSLLNSYVTWPWNATMAAGRFNSVPPWAYALGPLYLALLPVGGLLALVRGRINRRSPLFSLGLYAGLYLVAWMFLLAHMSRFFISALPMLAILTAAAAYALMGRGVEKSGEKKVVSGSNRSNVLHSAFLAALTVVVVLHATAQVYYTSNAIPYALGAQTQEEYLLQTSYARPYTDLRWANANLPADAHVLMGWGAHAYYLDRPYLYAEHVPGYVGRYADRPPEQFRQRLRDLGISHILIANPDQIARRGVFPPDFLDNSQFTERLYPSGNEPGWRIYVLKLDRQPVAFHSTPTPDYIGDIGGNRLAHGRLAAEQDAQL